MTYILCLQFELTHLIKQMQLYYVIKMKKVLVPLKCESLIPLLEIWLIIFSADLGKLFTYQPSSDILLKKYT